MRSTSYNRSARPSSNLPWWWIGIVWGIIALLIIVRIFSSSDTEASEQYLSVTPGEQSSVYISMTTSSKSRITSEQKLFATDKSVSVELGNAMAKNEFMTIDIDKGSELAYKSSTASGNTINLSKGRSWLSDITKPLQIELKNYNVTAPAGSIILIEQNGPYSNVYVLQGVATIETSVGNKDISAGSMISLLKSDLINPNTDLSEWIRPIEWSILEYPLFVRNNGASLLDQAGISVSTWTGTSTDGQSGSLIESTASNYIEVTEPKPGIMTRTNTITVMGNLLSKEVKKVTINNVEAVVSPVNETFVLQNISVTTEIFDIVYKAYDANNSLLQTGVISIFWAKWATQGNGPLVPETFPVSAKDFKILTPSGNPYSTTDRMVRVEWTIPANTVDYILVNDYRLQQFRAKSSSWYYFANMDYGTMKDGLNLYTIKFYRADNTLLYSQPFTIIKESKNATVSGE